MRKRKKMKLFTRSEAERLKRLAEPVLVAENVQDGFLSSSTIKADSPRERKFKRFFQECKDQEIEQFQFLENYASFEVRFNYLVYNFKRNQGW